MSSAVTVRLAAPEEYAAVGDLWEEAFTATFTITEWYRDNLHRVAEHAVDNEVWVATVDGELVGALLVPRPGVRVEPPGSEHDRPEELGFRLLGVRPSARGRGVARLLVAQVVRIARDRGLSRLGIWSGPQMTAAHRLYESLGFVRRPERETKVVDGGQRLLSFTLDLPSTPVGGSPPDPIENGAVPA